MTSPLASSIVIPDCASLLLYKQNTELLRHWTLDTPANRTLSGDRFIGEGEGEGEGLSFFFVVIVLCLFFCCFILCHQLSFLVLSFN